MPPSVAINTMKEKTRNYFKGKFTNIKEFFDDFDGKFIGKINIHDLYLYMNKKIKFKISKENIKKILDSYFHKNYLNYQNFKEFFFEEFSNNQVSIISKQYNNVDLNLKLVKSSSDTSIQINTKKKNDINPIEKEKELLNIIKTKQNLLLKRLVIKEVEDELNYNDFHKLILDIIERNKKASFSKEINNIFKKYKQANSSRINVKNFIEKLCYNNLSINAITNDNKFLNNFYINNSPCSNTKYISFCEQKNNNMRLEKLGRLSKNFDIKNTTALNLQKKVEKSKNDTSNINDSTNRDRDKSFKRKLFITDENIGERKEQILIYPRLRKFQLPKISQFTREQNKNTDIIDLLFEPKILKQTFEGKF